MSLVPVGFGSIISGIPPIGNSLRHRAESANTSNRTPTVTGNRQKFTFSAWVKRGALGTAQPLFGSNVSANTGIGFGFGLATGGSDALSYTINGVGNFSTWAHYRDPSAWLHVVFAIDSTQATQADRIKAYVNGVQVVFATNGGVLNQTYDVNLSGASQRFLNLQGTGTWFDGYVARVCFVDGQALYPSSFGYTDTTTNRWVSKSQDACKAVVDAGGTNSFMLDFNNGTSLTTLGYDKSSKGNNWTLNNFSLTAGVTYDWMTDTPTNNYAVLNPLDSFATGGVTLSNANLKVRLDRTSYNCWARAGFAIPSSGKWYFEWTPTAVNSGTTPYFAAGVVASDASRSTTSDSISDKRVIRVDNGNKLSSGVAGTTYGAATSTLPGTDVFMCAIDMDSGNIYFGKNGQWANGTGAYNQAFSGAAAAFSDLVSSGKTWMPFVFVCYGQNWSEGAVNYGQRPLSHQPTGYKALCTANLLAPPIPRPKEHFDVVTRMGFGASGGSVPLAFQPDAVWSKPRNVTGGNYVVDSVRGVSKNLLTYGALAESALSNFYTFTSSGYSPGSNDYLTVHSLVEWLWKAGGAPVTNNDGTVTAQVSANTLAGFSIATYTVPASGNFSVGHGMGLVPAMVITKDRDGNGNWVVWHKHLASATNHYLILNLTNAAATSAGLWGSGHTSLVTGGNVGGSDIAGRQNVRYCFAEVPGFSKAFSFTGNANADGYFCYLGFLPALILLKCSSTTGNWYLFDTVRNTINPLGEQLYPNLGNVGSTVTTLDAVSNGFKLRLVDAPNAAQTYIGFAWAKAPFQYANAF